METAVGAKLIIGVPFEMTNVTSWLAVPTPFEAVKLATLVPTAVGVPLITPLGASESPAGMFVALNVIGAVPLTVTELLNATPTVALKELVEANCGATPVGLVIAAELAIRNPWS
jgi:hypothetical protein